MCVLPSATALRPAVVGSIAMVRTWLARSWLLSVDHRPPPLLLRNNAGEPSKASPKPASNRWPKPPGPTVEGLGCTATARIAAASMPWLAALQLAPPSVLRCTPPLLLATHASAPGAGQAGDAASPPTSSD